MVIYLTINLINNKKYIGQDSNNNPNYLGSGVLLVKDIKKYGKQNFKKEILEYVDSLDKLNKCEEYWIKIFNAHNSSEYYNISEKGMGFPKGLKSDKQTSSKYKKIDQYTLEGKFIQTWDSIKEANKYYNISVGCITNVLKNKYKSAKGFIWKYHGEILELKSLPRPNHCLTVIQYDLKGLKIKEWNSQKDIIKNLNFNQSNLSKAINSGKKYKEYKWSYKHI